MGEASWSVSFDILLLTQLTCFKSPMNVAHLSENRKVLHSLILQKPFIQLAHFGSGSYERHRLHNPHVRPCITS